ncbi:SDR family oxidoreductase [Mucilaginibacter sp. Bleaf8]|uniref:SDR family oxidoreductase n=1 Tax=Mucilaginibacter sp. Bleaf8 TaxID=2834430 RepID=UPI001BCF8CB9|nr:SDR family oxidoreductase [Mucilaginibacter sp. Bleaf8]MBS7563847.1 SDR family oxidoreductase [Mucilaginibacter sp. Bleaf8]
MYDKPYHNHDLSTLSFLITGGGGFIGSNLVAYLLKYGAGKVRVLDNFSTGFRHNLVDFEHNPAFELIEGDIRDLDTCKKAVEDMDYVSHQAALGSVPRSVNDPLTTNAVNVTGFLNMLSAVKESGSVKRFVYAASSSTYGDSKELPKVEDHIGKPLSPYAVTKYVNELYADVFAKTYGLETIGLRYFNVFGPRQSPAGEYAAVIPLFIQAVKEQRPALINGDGEQTRDFTFVQNAVQANILALLVDNEAAVNQVYNVACGEQVSLNRLWDLITEKESVGLKAQYRAFRVGDVRHSIADISKAQRLLGYTPDVMLQEGLNITIDSFSQY